MGFEVEDRPRFLGAYSAMTFRYYDPPAKDLPPVSLSNLVSLSQYAIADYNRKNGTRYVRVKVLKAMTKPVAGLMYYITFEASASESDTETFQAKIYESLPFPTTQTEIKFVRIAPQ